MHLEDDMSSLRKLEDACEAVTAGHSTSQKSSISSEGLELLMPIMAKKNALLLRIVEKSILASYLPNQALPTATPTHARPPPSNDDEDVGPKNKHIKFS